MNPNHPETTGKTAKSWNCSAIFNKNTFADGTGSCQLTVLKMHPEICQIRLDFEQFALAGNDEENILEDFLREY